MKEIAVFVCIYTFNLLPQIYLSFGMTNYYRMIEKGDLLWRWVMRFYYSALLTGLIYYVAILNGYKIILDI